MARAPGLSVRVKLTLSYAGFLMVAGVLLLAAVWLAGQNRRSFEFLDRALSATGGLVPGNTNFLLRTVAPAAVVVLVFLLVLGLLGGWLLAGRMLAPLTRITDATRRAADGSLSHRIRLPGRRDEFRELADAFDAMLARLEAHVAEQRRFAANASHELRTPLATTQTLLDVARNDPSQVSGELVDRLHTVNARAIELTEALLVLSRADQRSFTREPVDLSLLVDEAAETLLPLAEQRGVTVAPSGEISPALGSHALLLQLTTNLVHNAIVHNLPEQGAVWVTTGVHPGTVELVVENTGEKLDPQLLALLLEPFQRGTERIHTDHAGVGLGLAIVKSITQAHDGTLTLAPRAAGGLRVTVQLPAAPLPQRARRPRAASPVGAGGPTGANGIVLGGQPRRVCEAFLDGRRLERDPLEPAEPRRQVPVPVAEVAPQLRLSEHPFVRLSAGARDFHPSEGLRHRRPRNILLNQVGVDGDRRRGAGAGCRDHLSARIDHVAGGPHTGGARSAGGIDGGEAGLVDLAAQAGEQTVVMGHVARPDEHRRSCDESAVAHLDAGQPVALDHQPGDRAENDAHSAGLQLGAFVRRQVVGVDEERHVVGPLPHQLRVLD